MKVVLTFETTSASLDNNCTFMFMLVNKLKLIKLVNMVFLIVIPSLHAIALSHFDGVVATVQAVSAAMCFQPQTIVDDALTLLLMFLENEPSVS